MKGTFRYNFVSIVYVNILIFHLRDLVSFLVQFICITIQ